MAIENIYVICESLRCNIFCLAHIDLFLRNNRIVEVNIFISYMKIQAIGLGFGIRVYPIWERV